LAGFVTVKRGDLNLGRFGVGHAEIGCDLGELVEGGLQVLDDFGCQNGGVGQIGGIAQTVVPEPEDIEIGLVALDQVLGGEAPDALGFTPLVAIGGVVAADKVVQVGAGKGVRLRWVVR
jgi:hypothetical protein